MRALPLSGAEREGESAVQDEKKWIREDGTGGVTICADEA